VHTRTSWTPKTGLRFRLNGGLPKAAPCSCYPAGALNCRPLKPIRGKNSSNSLTR
jgi:Uncharacterized protein conserved in bacteria